MPFKVRGYACGHIKNRDLCAIGEDERIWLIRVPREIDVDAATCADSTLDMFEGESEAGSPIKEENFAPEIKPAELEMNTF